MAVARKSTGVISKNQPGTRGAHPKRAQALNINDRKSFGLTAPVALWCPMLPGRKTQTGSPRDAACHTSRSAAHSGLVVASLHSVEKAFNLVVFQVRSIVSSREDAVG